MTSPHNLRVGLKPLPSERWELDSLIAAQGEYFSVPGSFRDGGCEDTSWAWSDNCQHRTEFLIFGKRGERQR